LFFALGEAELRQIAEIELRRVQQRIFESAATPFVFRLTEAAFEQGWSREPTPGMGRGTCGGLSIGCSSSQWRTARD